ncbi:hypothetical protein HK098_008391 [Nowakowskiella sp. JEL0407]|nr:hypothetical protein HK098_008391 [Nowakowskiella sp. JEL0407]
MNSKLLKCVQFRRCLHTSNKALSYAPKALEGIRVLELGQLIAGPFAGTLLAQYGAEVIKIEPPGKGDPLRVWRELDSDGTSPWWRSISRNKKSVTVNLRDKKGQELVRKIADKCDVVIENFKPGTVEKWGLGPEALLETNPSVIFTRVSGYGQTGPYAHRPGFASVCEAMGGFRYITGYPNSAPLRPNISLGDSLAGMNAAFGVLLGLIARNKLAAQNLANSSNKPERTGQVIDVAIYEAVFNMMEGILPAYDRLGTIREPSGTTVTGIVPTNAYLCGDSKYIIIGGNGDSIYKRLMKCANREDLTGGEYESNTGRVKHQEEIDGAIEEWTKSGPSKEILKILEDAGVPAGPIYNIADVAADPQFQARDMLPEVQSNGRPLKIPGITPKLMSTPGKIEWAGPELGEHTEEVLKSILNMNDSEILEYKNKQII